MSAWFKLPTRNSFLRSLLQNEVQPLRIASKRTESGVEGDRRWNVVLTLQSLSCNLSCQFRVARWAPAWWCWCGVLHFCCCGSPLPAYSWTSPHTPGTSCLSSSSHCAASMPPHSAICSAAPATHDQCPRRFLEHDRSKSQCFQVRPVTCCDLSVFLHEFEVYSIDCSKIIDEFHGVLIPMYKEVIEKNKMAC